MTAVLASLLLVLSGGDPALAVGDRGREERSISTEFSASDDRVVDAVTREDAVVGVQRRQRAGQAALAAPSVVTPDRPAAVPHDPTPSLSARHARNAVLRC
ncbi:hypothetical protein J7W19_24715 [Streptomyces mobaraensis NBRC 13819 = DSM 40847]|uniref:Uncharacterized protein n=1 Tax=Streptomyces mobaraensis (strain ATCC 29032 / DSM 40847 / JCM 4168 / NBRC 13819 / NCIMB 11159 / IPCR 16-22) TaxID=1223523 RepID=M3A1C4_STRM1|nr:hypothetical protein [Streptomyces mobaraensis]EME98848.1 hypothetical protein H340_19333 [Streptomyces mobaraensis NBRC 13819 = DSM 40847]QTT76154.1 hypothetical protein J7W19_24715 [Streptomyces mobaraensis NBRC 13819 = DSM 40847]